MKNYCFVNVWSELKLQDITVIVTIVFLVLWCIWYITYSEFPHIWYYRILQVIVEITWGQLHLNSCILSDFPLISVKIEIFFKITDSLKTNLIIQTSNKISLCLCEIRICLCLIFEFAKLPDNNMSLDGGLRDHI